jgi:hypothetical protein
VFTIAVNTSFSKEKKGKLEELPEAKSCLYIVRLIGLHIGAFPVFFSL